MPQEKSWFFPSIGLRVYLNQYPFVFFFSFLCAFGWIFGAAPASCFINAHVSLKNVPDYSPWAYSFLLGIALFALLHLLTASPRFQGIPYRQGVFALGIGALYGFYLFMKSHDVTWIVFSHYFGATVLAAFLWPLIGWRLSPEEVHAYFWNFVENLLKSVLVYCALRAFLGWLLTDTTLIHYLRYSLNLNIPDPMNNYYQVAAAETSTFLVFPWYLLGSVGSFLNSPEKVKEDKWFFGPRIALGIALVVSVLYLLSGFTLIGPWRCNPARYFIDGCYFFPLFVLFSIGLVRMQKGPGFVKWRETYTRIIAGYSILFLSISGIFQNPYWGGIWDDLDFYSLFMLLWFIGVFAYFLLRPSAGWVRPVFALWTILVLTLAGPFNPSFLDVWEHQNALKSELSSAGMLKDGQLVKPQLPLNRSSFGPIQGELYWFAQNQDLNWLRKSFPPELGKLDWGKEKGYANLPQLLDWLGWVKPLPAYPGSKNFSIQSPKAGYGLRRLGEDDVQDFNIRQGQVKNHPNPNPGYFLGFPNSTQLLFVEFDGWHLGEIPLDSLAKRISKEAAKGSPKDKMPPKAMTLEFENKKVKVKLYFTNIYTYLDGEKLKILSGSGTLLARRK